MNMPLTERRTLTLRRNNAAEQKLLQRRVSRALQTMHDLVLFIVEAAKRRNY